MQQHTHSIYSHSDEIPSLPIITGLSTTVSQTERLYTQHEVDNLVNKRIAEHPLLTQDLEEESRTTDKQIRQNSRTVAGLVKKSNRIILSISSHAFPIDIFPDTLNIEEGRITIINRHFLSSEVHSIDIKDIANVFINTTFIFSQLVIISRTYENNEIRMRNLKSKEAIFARRIIEGLRVFENKGIDTSRYSKESLISKLAELSTTQIIT